MDDPDDNNSEEDMAGVYDLKVQGKHLRKNPDDLESQYLKYGKNLVEKKIKIVDDKGRQSTALVFNRLHYYLLTILVAVTLFSL